MEVEVKLYGTLRRYRPESAVGAPHHPFTTTLPTGAMVSTLARHLGIPDGLINVAAVNGETVDVTTPLQKGDEINLFPPAAGG